TNFLEAAIGRQDSIGEGSELLKLEVLPYLNHIARRNRYVFREPPIGTETRPAHIWADMRVANLAMTTHTVAPSGRNHNMVTFLQASYFWNDATDFLYRAGDLMARDYWRRDNSVILEESVNQEHVGSAHPARCYLNQNLIRLDVGDRNIF